MRLPALLFSFLFVPLIATAQDFKPMLEKAQRAIAAGAAQEALAILKSADVAARTDQEHARVSFYRARAYETRGDASSAAAAYVRAIALDPNDGPALNNLAQLRARDGNTKEAMDLLNRAIGLNDSRKVLYQNALASIAKSAGELDLARRLYAEVLKAQPDNVAAESSLVRISTPSDALTHLREMVQRGAIVDAQSLAVERLGSAKAGNDSYDRRALLAIIVDTLVRQHVDLDAFAATPVASALAAYRQDPDLGEGVREIRLVFDRTPATASDFAWWSSSDTREVFTSLLREAGRQEARAQHAAAAERAYQTALQINGGNDPDSFFALANIYFAQDRRADLDLLAREYERPMFIGKGAAIRRGDFEKEYRFHLALGTMYAYLGQYGDESTPTSAIYQLKNAKRAAEDYNSIHPAQRIPLDTRTVELLAQSYAGVKDFKSEAAVRIDAAEVYAAAGKKASAKMTIEPLMAHPEALEVPYRERLQKLQVDSGLKTQWVQPAAQPVAEPRIDKTKIEESHYVQPSPPPAAIQRPSGQPVVLPYAVVQRNAVQVPVEQQKKILTLLIARRNGDKSANEKLKASGVVEVKENDGNPNAGVAFVMIDGARIAMPYNLGEPKKR